MLITSLLYVSESSLDPDNASKGVDNIVATARHRNPDKDITGALLFTGSHFAQILEGDKEAVEAMLSAIEADHRHNNLRVIDQSFLYERKFRNWSMAYFGPSIFLSRHVSSLLQSPAQSNSPGGGEWLSALLLEFIATSDGTGNPTLSHLG